MADRIAHPGRRYMRGMRGIQAHLPDMMIQHVEDGDLVLFLQQLDFLLPENIGRLLRRALVGRVREGHAGDRNFALALHDLRRRGLQDRIGVIADELVAVAHPIRPMRPVEERPGAGWRRLGCKGHTRPQPGKIGCGGRFFRSPARTGDRRRQDEACNRTARRFAGNAARHGRLPIPCGNYSVQSVWGEGASKEHAWPRCQEARRFSPPCRPSSRTAPAPSR